MFQKTAVISILFLSIITGCTDAKLRKADNLTKTDEYSVTTISLAGPIADARAELSGLAWYREHLILLPQYPGRFDNQLFTIPREDISAFLSGDLKGPLTPAAIPLTAPGLSDLDGYQGLEAIAFLGNQVFMEFI